MLAALRAVIGALVFLGVFFYPFQFTLSRQSLGYHSWQELNQQTSKSTAASSLSVTGQQSAETKLPQAGNKGKSPQISSQPEKMLPLPRQSTAVDPPPVEYPQIMKRVEVKGKVGISFDDGPFPGMTEQYLDVLEKYDTRATFFMVGQRVSLYPELARKVIEQGSEIGSHSWWHGRLDQLETGQVFADLQSVAEQVYDIVGKEVSLLRPPYGRHSEAMVAAAQELNQQLILWDVDPRDWEDPPPEEIVAKILNQTIPGSIIVLHEGHKNTLQALPEIIQKLRERDLEPVPISELFN
ncbi:polysaccharide deacetylase family protein [Desulfoscipio geothermicus]|uniref:Peptidoglycan/xylan/chitin deacetylase, PgdA/CDA1 family n=1 Tax=Desulfoscipio geothermicus DSM 3669 TaxID=1121426 RepID=A0A1I6DSH4_9FIRM|nr:polysaccharide deacetylase family protein [Desulfoscipio geothermicus]SFR08332.1 Peptidoglycan/xylan/chitin deacetylase, PgdA/CDA1 family [Desulfoscipio geothermicus DSM 3669]